MNLKENAARVEGMALGYISYSFVMLVILVACMMMPDIFSSDYLSIYTLIPLGLMIGFYFIICLSLDKKDNPGEKKV